MNILIVGLGSIAHKHINALKSLYIDFNLYALRSSQNAEEESGINNIYSLSDVDKINIDFAIISNPTSKHKETILDLLAFNCPLFIEKPLYHSLDLEELLLKVKERNVLTYVACNLRFLDSLLFIKNEIEQNGTHLNEVNVYCGSYLPSWRKEDFRNSYSIHPDLGGGVHLDLIHELDYLYWIFGMPLEVQSVLRNVSSLNIDAYDYANYNLIYQQFCANVVLNYFRMDYKRTLELVFEDETWLVNLASNSIYSEKKEIFKSDKRMIDTYVAQMEYFMHLIETNEKKSMNTIEDAYNVLKICLQ